MMKTNSMKKSLPLALILAISTTTGSPLVEAKTFTKTLLKRRLPPAAIKAKIKPKTNLARTKVKPIRRIPPVMAKNRLNQSVLKKRTPIKQPTLNIKPLASAKATPASRISPAITKAIQKRSIANRVTPARPTLNIEPDAPQPPTENGLRFIWTAVGDSYGSGEGNPVAPAEFHPDTYVRTEDAFWGEPVSGFSDEEDLIACHRSDESGAAKANRILEQRYPDIDFKFASFACSGAEVGDLSDHRANDEPEGPYQGADRDTQVPQLPQVSQAAAFAALHGEYDAMYISVGGNDAGFGEIIGKCIAPGDCSENTELIDDIRKRIKGVRFQQGTLPINNYKYWGLARKYEHLEKFIYSIVDPQNRRDRNFPVHPAFPEKIVITPYPDPVMDDDGSRCDVNDPDTEGDLLSPVTRKENAWAAISVLGNEHTPETINYEVYKTAENLGWLVADSHLVEFEGHGYCADDNFINTNFDALALQGDDMGGDARDFLGGVVLGSFTSGGAVAGGVVCGPGCILPAAGLGAIIGEINKEAIINLSAGTMHPNDNGYDAYAAAIETELDTLIKQKIQSHLAPPERLRVAQANTSRILFRWDDKSSIEDRYQVTITPIDHPGAGIVNMELPANASEFVYEAPARNLVVRFEVRACRAELCTDAAVKFGSNFVPKTPQSLSAHYENSQNLLGPSQPMVQFNWAQPNPSVLHYVVQYQNMTVASSPLREAIVRGDSEWSFNIGQNAQPEGTYRMRVAACNGIGCSFFSAYTQVDATGEPPLSRQKPSGELFSNLNRALPVLIKDLAPSSPFNLTKPALTFPSRKGITPVTPCSQDRLSLNSCK